MNQEIIQMYIICYKYNNTFKPFRTRKRYAIFDNLESAKRSLHQLNKDHSLYIIKLNTNCDITN